MDGRGGSQAGLSEMCPIITAQEGDVLLTSNKVSSMTNVDKVYFDTCGDEVIACCICLKVCF